jgi:hypothetical protein
MLFGEASGFTITLGVSTHLFLPQVGVWTGPGRRSAVLGAAMPEAAIDEYRYPPPRHDDVRSAAPVDLPVETEASTGSVKRLSELQLWCRVCLTPAREVTPLGGGDPFLRHDSTLARGFRPTRVHGNAMPTSDDQWPSVIPIAFDCSIRALA